MAIIPGQQKSDFSFVNPQQEKQKKLVYLLAAFLVVICLVVYFGFLNRPVSLAPAGYNPAAEQENQKLEGLKDATLNPPILKDSKFQSLVLPGDFPIYVGEKGRQNPFEPF